MGTIDSTTVRECLFGNEKFASIGGRKMTTEDGWREGFERTCWVCAYFESREWWDKTCPAGALSYEGQSGGIDRSSTRRNQQTLYKKRWFDHGGEGGRGSVFQRVKMIREKTEREKASGSGGGQRECVFPVAPSCRRRERNLSRFACSTLLLHSRHPGTTRRGIFPW